MARNIISLAPLATRQGFVRRIERERLRTAERLPVMIVSDPLRLTLPEHRSPKLTAEQRQQRQAAREIERTRLNSYGAVVAAAQDFTNVINRAVNTIVYIADYPLMEREAAIIYMDDDLNIRCHPNNVGPIDKDTDPYVIVAHLFIQMTAAERQSFIAVIKHNVAFARIDAALKARALFVSQLKTFRELDRTNAAQRSAEATVS